MKTLGICFGATTARYVKLNVPKAASGGAGDAAKIEATGRVAHEGDPKGVALMLLSAPALSGVDLSAISEPEAVEPVKRCGTPSATENFLLGCFFVSIIVYYYYDTIYNNIVIITGEKYANSLTTAQF